MQVKWIEKENNPFYPLPSDYNDLDQDGQRQARVNACRLWLCPGRAKKEISESFAASVRFFDLWYLVPDQEADFDPLFYDDVPLPTPTFHFDILRSWASNNRNITIAPRGSAKSFLVRKSCLVRMLARPMYTILYATSTNDNAKGTGQAMKDQFLHNQRILDDWSPEFPDGRIAPRRGEAPFGTELMQLKNGSWLRSISAESRQRGGRPRRYVLDDPEYDPKASTSMSIIRQYMDDLLFKIVLPMVMRKGCGVDWLATFVSRRHYAWHALQTEESTSGERVAQDPRFNLWSRMIVRAAYEDEEGELKSCWPEMWPPARTSKDDERVSLEEIREIIGTPNFLAEYMARPGESGEAFFDAISKEKHGWWLSQVDELLETNPRASESYIHWYKDGEEMRLPMNEFLTGARLFMSVDTSYTSTSDSDYKVACLMAVNSDNDLFVMDLWSGQCQESRLITEVFQMADRWKCPSIHPEVIKQGIGLFHNIEALIKTRATDMTGVAHLPAVKKMNPGPIDKSSKIAALNLRFEHGKIKMPLWMSNKAQWARLFDQVSQFNPDAKDGGLQHDDEIDCVAMSQFILRGRVRAPEKDPDIINDPIQSLKDGQITDSGGNVIGFGVDWRKIPVSDMLEIMDQKNPWKDNPDGRTRV
jgi:phage terminase large subunit-like protein